MDRTKLILAYVCLVGIPLLGIFGILWLGRHLVAPISVSGPWNIEIDRSALQNNPCTAPLAEIRQPFLEVIQAGPQLRVRLGDSRKTTLQGVIEETTLKIGNASAKAADCRDPLALQLQATVNRRGERVLTGTLAIAGCNTCSILPFRAVRGNR